MITRRTGLGTLAAAAWLTARPVAAQPSAFREAPGLAERVRRGELPPLAERLPARPLVVTPLEVAGRHGGQWRQAMRGASDLLLEMSVGYTRLVRWNRAWTDVEPDVAEGVETSRDGREYVFTLRRGHRWSDGHPFTADDILFWYDSILTDREVTPAVPRWLTANGRAVKVTRLDELRVSFAFDGPQGMLLKAMATSLGADILAGAPAHWLRQFHRRHNADAIERVVAAERASDWRQLLTNKVSFPNRWRDAARPVLDAWRLTGGYTGTQRVIAERNPYHHRVDNTGAQLPYMDRVVFDVLEDGQALILKAINGEIDMQHRHIDTTDARPVIVQNQQRGRYRLFNAQPAWSNALLINLNQTSKNPALRAAFRQKPVRVALSHAINRPELNELIYAGQSRPWQAAPRPDTALFDERMALQFTEFDPARANALLDEAGMARRDADGFRLLPEGTRFSFAVDVLTTVRQQIDALEIIRRYWRAVGVDMQVRALERSLAFARLQANNHDANAWQGGGGYDQLGLLDPKWYFPHEYESSYATAWGIWFQNPRAPHAEEPSPAAKRQQALYVELQTRPGTAEQLDLMRQILAITREEFYVIGTNMEPDRFGIVKLDLRNVPQRMPNTFFYMTPGPTQPEQYSWR
jgi:peptide/nickel transport system substrate-binding protein